MREGGMNSELNWIKGKLKRAPKTTGGGATGEREEGGVSGRGRVCVAKGRGDQVQNERIRGAIDQWLRRAHRASSTLDHNHSCKFYLVFELASKFKNNHWPFSVVIPPARTESIKTYSFLFILFFKNSLRSSNVVRITWNGKGGTFISGWLTLTTKSKRK